MQDSFQFKTNQVKGVVKWFNDAKGYGFIDTDTVKNIFVHYSALPNVGFQTLHEGQEVTFDLCDGAKGPQAFNVVKKTMYKIVSTKGRQLDHRYFTQERAEIEANLFNMGSDTETAIVVEVKS